MSPEPDRVGHSNQEIPEVKNSLVDRLVSILTEDSDFEGLLMEPNTGAIHPLIRNRSGDGYLALGGKELEGRFDVGCEEDLGKIIVHWGKGDGEGAGDVAYYQIDECKGKFVTSNNAFNYLGFSYYEQSDDRSYSTNSEPIFTMVHKGDHRMNQREQVKKQIDAMMDMFDGNKGDLLDAINRGLIIAGGFDDDTSVTN